MRFSLSIFLSAIVMACCAGTASAGVMISTPTGLNPGDHFRIMFVTSGTINATSSNVSTYDTFVNTDANGATYNGSVISWQAIVSTPSISAINHIGVTGDAVYLPDGTKVASTDGTSGLWGGTSLLAAPNEYLDGTTPNSFTWSGTNPDGSAGNFVDMVRWVVTPTTMTAILLEPRSQITGIGSTVPTTLRTLYILFTE